MSSQHNEQDILLYTSEQLEPRELGYEQVKFIFRKLSQWLLERRQEALEDIMEMLEKLRHLHPRAYKILMRMIQAAIAMQFDPNAVPAGPPLLQAAPDG